MKSILKFLKNTINSIKSIKAPFPFADDNHIVITWEDSVGEPTNDVSETNIPKRKYVRKTPLKKTI